MIASLLVLAALSAPAADAAPVVQHRIYIVERTLAPGRAPDEALAALIRRRFPCELDPPERADAPWRLTIVTT